jgi:hypothetical protein
MLYEPHIEPLTLYAARLRESGFDVPESDPLDGGVNAQVLFQFEKPGPMTASEGGSGFVSRNNDDPSAEARSISCNVRELSASYPQLECHSMVEWNA